MTLSQRPNRLKSPQTRAGLELALLALVFLLLSLVFTRDIIAFIAQGTPCGAGDSVMFAWNFWWVAEQLAHGKSFFKCDWAMLPFGIRTVYHTLIPLHCIILAPITWLFGPIVSSNLHLILSFTLGALGMCLLVRFLTGSYTAGLCGGIVYGYSTFHWFHAIGHYNLTATELLPFCLLFLLKWLKSRKPLNLAIASGLLALNLYVDYTTTLVLGLCCLPVFTLGVAQTLKAHGWLRVVKSLCPALVLFSVVCLPIGYHLYEFSSLFDSHWGKDYALAESTSPDLLGYLLPDHLTWHSAWVSTHSWLKDMISDGLDRSQFFGLTGLVLACLGTGVLYRKDRSLLVCLLLSLVICLAVSLGPKPRAFGLQLIPSIVSPYRLPTSLPYLGSLRIPGRFGLGVALIGAVLVGVGTAKVLAKPKTREATTILTVLVAGLLFAERVHEPFWTKEIEVPPLYEVIPTLLPKPEGIVITPFYVWSGQGMLGQFPFVDPTFALLYQTEHLTPMINGHSSRIAKEMESYYCQAPLTSSLMALQSGTGIDVQQILAEKDYVRQITATFGITHIVCDYRADYWQSGLPMKFYIEEILSGKKVYEDETGRIYQLPLPEAPLPSQLLIKPDHDSARLYLMEGWHKPIMHNGQKRLVFDPQANILNPARSSRLRVIFRNWESSRRLHYSFQLSPVLRQVFQGTVFKVDLDGRAIARTKLTQAQDASIRGSVDVKIGPGLHYLALTPCLDELTEASRQEPSHLPLGLSDRAMLIDRIELSW